MAAQPVAAQLRCLSPWPNGSWVLDDTSLPVPPYESQAPAAAGGNPQSQNMMKSPMCAMQQSWRWRWHSHDADCPFVQPSRVALCRRLSHRRVLLFGDSLTQQLYVSLASMAGNAVGTATPNGCKGSGPTDCVWLCDGTALLCHRKQFGLALDVEGATAAATAARNCTVQPTTVAPLKAMFAPQCVGEFDLVVINEFAHWVGQAGVIRVERCLVRVHGASEAVAAAAAAEHVLSLYAGQAGRSAAFLASLIQKRRVTGLAAPLVLFRTSIPGLPPAHILPPDTGNGTPPVFVAPRASTHTWANAFASMRSSPWNHHLWMRMNSIGRRAYTGAGLRLLDVEAPMLHRVDGHLDPLHYCLPGPPDFYSAALFNYAMGEPHPAHRARPGVDDAGI